MLEFLKKQLSALLEERGALKSDLDNIIATPEKEGRDLNEAEKVSFGEARAKVVAKDAEIDAMSRRVKDAEEDEARSKRVSEVRAQTAAVKTRPQGGASVTSEPSIYGERNQRGHIVKPTSDSFVGP
jgi:hypothetical protein